jgi:hypothetical protein
MKMLGDTARNLLRGLIGRKTIEFELLVSPALYLSLRNWLSFSFCKRKSRPARADYARPAGALASQIAARYC